MRIATTTPTGNVGRHVLTALVRAGVRPLVLARHPDSLPAELGPLIDVVAVDQRDPDAVAAATAGVDRLFWVSPPSHSDDPLADYARAGAALVHAVTENGIGRVVFQSSIGAELRHGAGEIDGLGRTEQSLDELNIDVTHLRCGFFFTNLILQLDAVRAGTIPVLLPLDQTLPWVAPRDIAEVATARLLSDEWSGRCVQAVDGPADLTWPEACAIVADAIGQSLVAERIADDEMRTMLQGAGLSDAAVESILGMSTGLRDGFVPEQPRSPVTTTPTTLAAWAYDELRPLLR